MWETVFIWTIIGLCVYAVGRRFYRQWRGAIDPKAAISCDCGCSSCGATGCEGQKKSG